VAIASGLYHSLAVKSDGTVWTWGDNGTNTDSDIPVQVSGINGVVAAAGGSWYSLVLKSDGTVWDWGTIMLAN